MREHNSYTRCNSMVKKGFMCDGLLMLTEEKPGHSEGLEAPEDGEEYPPATWKTEV